MDTYFNLRYEFDKEAIFQAIDCQVKDGGADYVCVADGVILNIANRHPDYLRVINGGMFAICDSSYVPMYIRWIHGRRYEQYCGSDIFKDIIDKRKYRMAFLGTYQKLLDSLRTELSKRDPRIMDMMFYELPFAKVTEFDYEGIARMLDEYDADIIWVALGAPKQEYFMNLLKPHLKRGVMIAVGAAFKFFSDEAASRAPQWMVRHHLEFVHRIYKEPRKQMRRCYWIVRTLPGLLYNEYRSKKRRKAQP